MANEGIIQSMNTLMLLEKVHIVLPGWAKKMHFGQDSGHPWSPAHKDHCCCKHAPYTLWRNNTKKFRVYKSILKLRQKINKKNKNLNERLRNTFKIITVITLRARQSVPYVLVTLFTEISSKNVPTSSNKQLHLMPNEIGAMQIQASNSIITTKVYRKPEICNCNKIL